MVYRNSTFEAIIAMERARTGNYGEDEYDDSTAPERCEICGEYCDDMYEYSEYKGKIHICLRCLQEECMEAMSDDWRKL